MLVSDGHVRLEKWSRFQKTMSQGEFSMLDGTKAASKKVHTFSNPWEKTKQFNHPGIAFLQRNFGIKKIL